MTRLGALACRLGIHRWITRNVRCYEAGTELRDQECARCGKRREHISVPFGLY